MTPTLRERKACTLCTSCPHLCNRIDQMRELQLHFRVIRGHLHFFEAQLLLDLRPERVGPVAVDREQELYRVTGTVHGAESGTGICTSGA